MDTISWRKRVHAIEPPMDWRTQLSANARQRIVNKIMETLKTHLPFSGQEGLQELKKIAVRSEEKIYTAATSQSDYLRKISLKMLTMGNKSQNTMANPLMSNPAINREHPAEPDQVLMDTNSWMPAQGCEPLIDAGDWRTQLQEDSRQRVVNKIMETLKTHLPFSGQEGLQELKKIAVRFEEKIYTAATSQSDYLRKIALKMLMMGNKSQNTMANPLMSDPAINRENPASQYTMANPLMSNPAINREHPKIQVVMDAGDWRTLLQEDSRQRIVNKIMETLKRHFPFSGQDGLKELEQIAVSFEEEIYTTATSQSDYLRKISLKMLTMDYKSQNTMANPLTSNPAINSENPADPGSGGFEGFNPFVPSVRMRPDAHYLIPEDIKKALS